MPLIALPQAIPYVCQYASPDRVAAFVHGEAPLEEDSRWQDYGAASPAEYAHWAQRSCGVVCVKMAVEGLAGLPPRPVMDWVRAGLALDGYLTELRPDRPERPVEKGWRHAALAALAEQHGLDAHLAAGMALPDLAAHLRAGRVVIASVSSELGEAGPVTRKGGHLVVVTGVEVDAGGTVQAVILHNPSGRTPALQAAARIPAARFAAGFAGRGIVISAPRRTRTAPPPPAQSSRSRP